MRASDCRRDTLRGDMREILAACQRTFGRDAAASAFCHDFGLQNKAGAGRSAMAFECTVVSRPMPLIDFATRMIAFP